MKSEARVVWRFAKLPLIACLLIIMVGCGALQRVSPRMYRSGQPTGKGVWVAHSKGIKSIINLRGFRPGRMEWDVELGVAGLLNTPIYFHSMSSGRLPTKDEVLYLLDLFETVETPVLIHCAAGVDRTGLACVLWMMVMEGEFKQEARKQLSFWKGHLSSWQNTGELDRVAFSCFSSGGRTGKSALS